MVRFVEGVSKMHLTLNGCVANLLCCSFALGGFGVRWGLKPLLEAVFEYQEKPVIGGNTLEHPLVT
jgi:hypothetical protein